MAFASEQAVFLRGSFSVSRKKCTIFITIHFFPLNISFASVPRAAVERVSYNCWLILLTGHGQQRRHDGVK